MPILGIFVIGLVSFLNNIKNDMLPDFLHEFNSVLAEFQQLFPRPEWTDEFKTSLIDDFSFYSTKIEEESIEYGDTIRFLRNELVRKGHLKGFLEVNNHRDVLESLISNFEDFELTEEWIKQVHESLMKNELSWEDDFKIELVGQYRNHPVVGHREPFYPNKEYVVHYNLEISMASYVDLFQQKFAHIKNDEEETHLITALAYFHNKFLNYIHPFADGNGRTARIIMGTLMMKNDCPPVFSQILNSEDMFAYINTLIECEKLNSDTPFATFLAKGMVEYMSKRIAESKAPSPESE